MSMIGTVALAAIVLVSPENGARVPTLPPAQKVVLAQATKDERRTVGASYPNGPWGVSAPLVLKWRATAGETGSWKIRVGTNPDLTDGTDYWIFFFDIKPDADGTYSYEVPRANLELGRRYWWRVWSNVKCAKWSCGAATGPNGCACGATGPAPASETRTFVTEDVPPRWIAIEGRTKNIRDLGGWRTLDGRRVRQGLAFRGEALNDNSVNGEVEGRNRLTFEDADYLTKTLGIRTDLDLRTKREISTMTQSPLGPGVAFIHRSAPAYKEIFTPDGMKTMAANFRVFCDEKNYPVFFHCIGGADRTGSLAYALNGVLGVGRVDLERDWESTFYPDIPNVVTNATGKPFINGTYWRSSQHFDDGFARYAAPGDTLRDRIERYLLACGVTKEEIAKVRAIMLEADAQN